MNDKLDQAYALDGADAVKRLYADWAQSYDADFAQARGYQLPDAVAAALIATPHPTGPVLDVGAGTGLVAQALRARGLGAPIDGVDLSAQMLTVAREKGLYHHLFEADVTRPIPGAGPYAAIVSAGTFTHGHVGPQALPALAQVAMPGAIFVLSINEGVFETKGFAAFLDGWKQLSDLDLTRVPIYAADADEHAQDTALIARFRLT